MKKNALKPLLALVLCLMMAFAATSVFADETEEAIADLDAASAELEAAYAELEAASAELDKALAQLQALENVTGSGTQEDPYLIGEGEKTFGFVVIADEDSVFFVVKTDEQFLDKALLAYGLIDGSESEYGLFVTEVMGIVLEWTEESPMWWRLLCTDGTAEPADSEVGVSSIEVQDGMTYIFAATEGY